MGNVNKMGARIAPIRNKRTEQEGKTSWFNKCPKSELKESTENKMVQHGTIVP